MNVDDLISDSRGFLTWLVDWHYNLPEMEMEELLHDAGGDPDTVALFAVDLTRGFAEEGPLSSERVASIVPVAVRLFKRAAALGMRHFILPQDAHSPDALEFSSFPAHCIGGTDRAQTVSELRALPFSQELTIVEKDSISSTLNTDLGPWLDAHPEVKTFVVIGDCTDFCIYQLAMHLRLRANAWHLQGVRVVVPSDGVDTFHIPVDVAQEIGAMPHHGDLLHLVFLYSMAQNGVEIVKAIR
ncbi:MAG: cysteine hydrolase family protein [Anaerolineae bacterium]|jgi:nicotinamidase-related amidase